MGSCCSVHKDAPMREATMMAKDPVCGMEVEVNGPYKHVHGNETVHFCSAYCLKKCRDHPEGTSVCDDAIYTCPMHPEVRQKGPGTCPKCGMALEPVEVSLEEGQNPE